jgi:3-phenylpropionate/trans-cinnamate dioxygenase ferredoxin subunit
MEDYIFVCLVTELPPGSMRTYSVRGKQIALANVDGSFFAVDDTCTHEQCSLGSDGALDGNVIICGCHGAQYDVMTGDVLAPPAPRNVSSYETKIEDEKVMIKMT